ncbi:MULTISPECIES: diacylglycerol kinase family protein [Acinetobacter]|uniref:Diacylglycerol kinase n=1 Tax=Acinetobacter piscicola TaxID=2006115 RepID=A0A4Q4GST9_9GAMM|nr:MULTISPECIES: diacylglycerol kinase family protein [Acinetobacter]QOW46818.1 diacylglycerol kinase [Acinetobacter piscicola]RYL24678.1 diacylglycerol kinase [Acinetobacter piscicola]
MNIQLRPLSLIYNEKSGFHARHKEHFYEEMMTIWTLHGFEIQVFEISSQPNIQSLMKEVFQRHHQYAHQGIIVAAGGDGTLNAVASQLMHHDIPMGILPLGTFNYVARVLNIPLDLLKAAQVIATGQPRAVHVACINDQIYLNNASLGLYPLFIKKREIYNRKWGRFPLNAYTSGLDVLIRDRKELKLEVQVDGQKYPVKTPLIFFGNNQLQLQEMKLKIAKCAEVGLIAGVVIAKGDKATLFKTLFQTIRGKLENASDVYSFGAQKVIVYSKKPKLTVALDGEIVEMTTPLKLHVEKNALNIMVPHVTSSV